MDVTVARTVVVGTRAEVTAPEDWYLKSAEYDPDEKHWVLVIAKSTRRLTRGRSDTDVEVLGGPLPF